MIQIYDDDENLNLKMAYNAPFNTHYGNRSYRGYKQELKLNPKISYQKCPLLTLSQIYLKTTKNAIRLFPYYL